MTAWTPVQLADLHRMWLAGATSSAIARHLGKTASAVIGMARRQGLPGRPSPIIRGGPKPVRLPRKPSGVSRTKLSAVPPKPPAPPITLPGTECRWTDSDRVPWVFCGKPCQEGFSWCPEHRARVYQAGTAVGGKRLHGAPGPDMTKGNPDKMKYTHFNKHTDAKWGQP